MMTREFVVLGLGPRLRRPDSLAPGRAGGKQPQQGTRRGGWATRKQGDNPPHSRATAGQGQCCHVLPMGAPKCPNMPQYLDIFINISINIC